MLISNPWPAAVTRVAFAFAVAVIVGLALDAFAETLLLGAVGLLGYNIWQLYRLEHWLRCSKRAHAPRAEGLWGAVFDGFNRQQKRRRARRERLASLLRRFRESANAMPDGTVILSGHGEMQWWNRTASRYLGLSWPRDQGQRIANLIRHPDFADYLERGDWGDPIKISAPHDPLRVVEIRIVPYGDEQRMLLARDVSELHRLETMRRDFVGNISHELRTPLTVLRGMSEQISDLPEPNADDLERPLVLMDQQIERMSRLVDDLLLLSRLETEAPDAQLDPVNMPELLKALVDEARTLSEGAHTITFDVDEAVAIEADAEELRSAFSNLLANAVKYTEPGGRIAVRWFKTAGAACLTVADTGRGIPAHHLPRLTERFYRVDSGRATRDGGTGLGLAIVKHVLSRHGGHLEVTSTLDEGSTFSCVFPTYSHQRSPERSQ
ncbi:MAG: phosphate regulon sensor histidine kinase PhoR [Spiribacter sp.]|nr:phosphate regulon sensor histidine kinase PhoR [Spiribacter sp.]